MPQASRVATAPGTTPAYTVTTAMAGKNVRKGTPSTPRTGVRAPRSNPATATATAARITPARDLKSCMKFRPREFTSLRWRTPPRGGLTTATSAVHAGDSRRVRLDPVSRDVHPPREPHALVPGDVVERALEAG